MLWILVYKRVQGLNANAALDRADQSINGMSLIVLTEATLAGDESKSFVRPPALLLMW